MSRTHISHQAKLLKLKNLCLLNIWVSDVENRTFNIFYEGFVTRVERHLVEIATITLTVFVKRIHVLPHSPI